MMGRRPKPGAISPADRNRKYRHTERGRALHCEDSRNYRWKMKQLAPFKQATEAARAEAAIDEAWAAADYRIHTQPEPQP